MPSRVISSRLAARAGTRQVEATAHADAAADRADCAVAAVWGQLLRVLRTKRSAGEAYHAALAVLQTGGRPALLAAPHAAIDGALRGLVTWGHRESVRAILGTVPLAWLRTVAVRRVSDGSVRGHQSGHLRPDDLRADSGLGLPSGIPEGIRGWSGEGQRDVGRMSDRGGQRRGRGALPLVEDAPGAVALRQSTGGLTFADLLALLRDPADLSDEEQRELFDQFLFPPPSHARVDAIVYGRLRPGWPSWEERLAGATKIPGASPQALAHEIATGYLRGENQREIAKRLLPIVDGVKSTARRIARTEGLRIASDIQHDAWRAMDDLIAGFQVHATLDLVTRPEHRHRNGAIFHRQPDGSYLADEPVPGPPGKVSREMPHPPQEFDGSIAWY